MSDISGWESSVYYVHKQMMTLFACLYAVVAYVSVVALPDSMCQNNQAMKMV